MAEAPIVRGKVLLAPYVTLRAGGLADEFAVAPTTEALYELFKDACEAGKPFTILGWGSNVLPSDYGVGGVTVVNASKRIKIAKSGEVIADCGFGFQELFLKTAQAGLRGLEFAVGIPGTLGGALVSNAGAYRSNVSEFVTGLEISMEGRVPEWVGPAWMKFSYRDSLLRSASAPKAILLRVAMKLPKGDSKRIYDEAREYQRQRISKQPGPASAGSFFKNVNHAELANGLDALPIKLKAAGVVPAGYLIEAVGLKGRRLGGAMFGRRHANFMLNIGHATATEIRNLATLAKRRVMDRFGVLLEEEVLYLGRWDRFDDPTEVEANE